MSSARVLDLESLVLRKGNYMPNTNHERFCVMEAVAYVTGEKWSDHPSCASPLITSFLTCWQDAMNAHDRQVVKAFIPRLGRTKSTDKVELRRAYMALDWYCRTALPVWLRSAGLNAEAEALLAAAPIVDMESAQAVTALLLKAQKRARGVARARDWIWAGTKKRTLSADAAGGAWARTGDAIWSWCGADELTGSEPGTAAAARSAIYAAVALQAEALNAAPSQIRPIVKELQVSAFDLVDRLIKVKA